MGGFKDLIEPMTLGNMRANGVRSLDVSCWNCHHRAIMSADPWPDDVPVRTFGPRMVCTRCGIIGADARPNWKEKALAWPEGTKPADSVTGSPFLGIGVLQGAERHRRSGSREPVPTQFRPKRRAGLRRQSHTSDADDEAAVSLEIPVSVSGRGAPPVIKESQSPIRARRTEHVASVSTRALHHRAWGHTDD
jgi:hypothetical protein